MDNNEEVEKETDLEENYILENLATYVNAQTRYGNTALHLACIRGLSDVVKILMKNALLVMGALHMCYQRTLQTQRFVSKLGKTNRVAFLKKPIQ